MTHSTRTARSLAAVIILLTLGWSALPASDRPAEADQTEPPASSSASPDKPGEEEKPETIEVPPAPETPRLEASRAAYEKVKAYGTEDLEEWLLALEWCESHGDPMAVNAEDLDGTPSYGILQFKVGTFYGFASAYGIEIPTGNKVVPPFMDPETQRAIVRRMMQDPSVKWERQFPWCVQRHIGWPPGVVK